MAKEERRTAYAVAFLAQGRSDWAVYQYLASATDPVIEQCHQLHYLQMAAEKLAKAYRVRDLPTDLDQLTRHHTGFEEFVNAFLVSSTIKEEYRGKASALQTLQKESSRLAREIEKLAPAIERETAPENTEYPWERDGKVLCPCTHNFANLSLLREASGRSFLRLIERAFRDYDAIHIS